MLSWLNLFWIFISFTLELHISQNTYAAPFKASDWRHGLECIKTPLSSTRKCQHEASYLSRGHDICGERWINTEQGKLLKMVSASMYIKCLAQNTAQSIKRLGQISIKHFAQKLANTLLKMAIKYYAENSYQKLCSKELSILCSNKLQNSYNCKTCSSKRLQNTSHRIVPKHIAQNMYKTMGLKYRVRKKS